MLLKLRRKLSALLVALLVFSCFVPGTAIADTLDQRVIFTNDTSTVYQTIIRADNVYNAAALACGYTPQLLSDAVKSAASDPNYGGDFYSYAQTFQVFGNDAIPSFVPSYLVPSIWSEATLNVYGGYLYSSDTTNIAHTLAKAALDEIVAAGGATGGGGGGDVDTSDGLEFSFNISSSNYYYSSDYMRNPNTSVSGDVKVTLTSAMCDALRQYDYVAVCLTRASSFSTSYNEATYALDCIGHYNSSPDVRSVKSNRSYAYISGRFKSFGLSNITIPNWLGSTHALGGGTSGSNGYRMQGWDLWFTNYTIDDFLRGGGGSEPDPDGDWPDDPEIPSPTPPELPEIDDNPVPTEPTETDISVNLPDINVTVGGSATDLTDVISILKVINGNLVTINDNLEDEFNSVINAFRAIGGQIEQLAQRIREHCQHIRTSIYQNTTHLENEIYKLFHWLKDELDFGFDDSSIVDYLKRILDKLNNVSYQPNPIADPFNFFDWLMGLLGGFLASLVSGLPGVLQDLLTDLSSLTEYFPFSMPWDVYGLLLLFAHDPVTPVFDLPWNFAANHTAQIHIDLSQYDGIMAIVRAVEKVIFAAGLAVFTMRMFKPTDVLGDD